jgi:hypothetical protein
MSVTSSDQLAGLLVAVITGGRPKLRERATATLLPALEDLGVKDVVWVVSDQDAPGYEQDQHQLSVYPRTWAEEYAASHWMGTTRPQPGAFLGAFAGREWACQLAEQRGCWGVLQLDDNITDLFLARRGTAGWDVVRENGGLALFTDLLAGIALSTNSWMTGAHLSSVPRVTQKVARAGFPYSLFIERVGPGREPWYGPFEDDITHAFQYGTRSDGATASISPLLNYHKENKAKSGMRAKYDHTRSVQLQRMFPESARISVRTTRSNGRGTPRVFHTMSAGAIRNPLAVRDLELFGSVRTTLVDLMDEWHDRYLIQNRTKVTRRTSKLAGKDNA